MPQIIGALPWWGNTPPQYIKHPFQWRLKIEVENDFQKSIASTKLQSCPINETCVLTVTFLKTGFFHTWTWHRSRFYHPGSFSQQSHIPRPSPRVWSLSTLSTQSWGRQVNGWRLYYTCFVCFWTTFILTSFDSGCEMWSISWSQLPSWSDSL